MFLTSNDKRPAPSLCFVFLTTCSAVSTPARRCSPRMSPTIHVCRRDGAVVDHLYLRARRRGSMGCRLLVQMDGYGWASPRSTSTLHQSPCPSLPSRCQLPWTDSTFVGDPWGSRLSGRRGLEGDGTPRGPSRRREWKTKRTFSACSYACRSRPQDFDPTAPRGPRGGRYFIYRPPPGR